MTRREIIDNYDFVKSPTIMLLKEVIPKSHLEMLLIFLLKSDKHKWIIINRLDVVSDYNSKLLFFNLIVKQLRYNTEPYILEVRTILNTAYSLFCDTGPIDQKEFIKQLPYFVSDPRKYDKRLEKYKHLVKKHLEPKKKLIFELL